MESRLRYRFFGPMPILRAAGIPPGGSVLEVGCGTGFFTLPAARLIGDQGRLVAMDVLAEPVDFGVAEGAGGRTEKRRVVKGDAADTGLEGGGFDGCCFLA